MTTDAEIKRLNVIHYIHERGYDDYIDSYVHNHRLMSDDFQKRIDCARKDYEEVEGKKERRRE